MNLEWNVAVLCIKNTFFLIEMRVVFLGRVLVDNTKTLINKLKLNPNMAMKSMKHWKFKRREQQLDWQDELKHPIGKWTEENKRKKQLKNDLNSFVFML